MNDAVDYGVHTGDDQPFVFYAPPPMVGYWQMGAIEFGTRLHLTKRPRWLTRVFLRAMCEWVWVDLE